MSGKRYRISGHFSLAFAPRCGPQYEEAAAMDVGPLTYSAPAWTQAAEIPGTAIPQLFAPAMCAPAYTSGQLRDFSRRLQALEHNATGTTAACCRRTARSRWHPTRSRRP